jgi:hypothetical protein
VDTNVRINSRGYESRIGNIKEQMKSDKGDTW